MKLNAIDWLAWLLIVIGALNWGLVGLFNFNLVEFIFGSVPMLAKIIYIIVGVAAVYNVVMCKKHCKPA